MFVDKVGEQEVCVGLTDFVFSPNVRVGTKSDMRTLIGATKEDVISIVVLLWSLLVYCGCINFRMFGVTGIDRVRTTRKLSCGRYS